MFNTFDNIRNIANDEINEKCFSENLKSTQSRNTKNRLSLLQFRCISNSWHMSYVEYVQSKVQNSVKK